MEDRPNDMPTLNQGERVRGLIKMTVAFEASLVLVALGLGWLIGCWPLETLAWKPVDLGRGLLATVPMVLALVIGMRLPISAIDRLKTLLQTSVLLLFRGASWTDLALISLAAGIGEELLFRGLFQYGLTESIDHPLSAWIAITITSILFGLAHALSRSYAVLATVVSFYLGWLLLKTGNLLVPIVAHALYDFVAFVYLFQMRQSSGAELPDNSGRDDPQSRT